MIFEFGLLITAMIAGTVASIAGFGIGSLITPVLSLTLGTKLAIAAVSIPHLIATAIRFWVLRTHIDKKVFINFGILSAAGGLVGALLNAKFATHSLTLIFGVILLFSGFMGLSELSQKMRFYGASSWIAGAISGILGGLVGNQGGIRSAAMLGFNISKESFIATATAVGLVVDGARMPIYFVTQKDGLLDSTKWIALASMGALIGTFLGMKLLKKLPDQLFRKVVSALIFLLGGFMLYQGLSA